MICRIFQKTGEKKNGVLLQGQSSSSNYMQEASNSSLSHLVDHTLKVGSAQALQSYQTLQSLQNQNQTQLLLNNIPHETDHLKSLITNSSSSSVVCAVSRASALAANNVPNGLQTSKTKMKQDNDLLKTLLIPHQDYYCAKEQEAAPYPKICKTESGFSHFQSSHSTYPNFRNPVSSCAEYDMIMAQAHQNTNTPGPNYKQSPLLFRSSSDNDHKNVSCGFPVYGADNEMSISSSSSCSRVLVPFNKTCFKQMLLDPPSKITAGESWPFHHF